jgi:hypothetical protein
VKLGWKWLGVVITAAKSFIALGLGHDNVG